MIEIGQHVKMILDNYSLDIEDVEYICEQFSIGKFKCINKHFENTANVNILFETVNGKFVAKFLHTEIERYKSIYKIMKILHINNVPVLLPLQNNKGEHYTNIKNYTVQLTPFMEACKFSFEDRQVVSSGMTLKKMHTVLKDYDEITDPIGSIYPSRKILGEGLTRLKELEDSISLEQFILTSSLHDEITRMWSNQNNELPYSIIHGDWNERNQLFTQQGKVCSVLDFDFVQRKERLFDVAYVLWNFLLHRDFRHLSKPFMRGYGPLTEQERNILQVAIARVSCFFICTASLSTNPVVQINRQLEQQVPFIKYILSKDGEKELNEICC